MAVREDTNNTCIARVFDKTDPHFSVLDGLTIKPTRENETVTRTLIDAHPHTANHRLILKFVQIWRRHSDGCGTHLLCERHRPEQLHNAQLNVNCSR